MAICIAETPAHEGRSVRNAGRGGHGVLDFAVEIERLRGQDYRVATRGPAGEVMADIQDDPGYEAQPDELRARAYEYVRMNRGMPYSKGIGARTKWREQCGLLPLLETAAHVLCQPLLCRRRSRQSNLGLLAAYALSLAEQQQAGDEHDV
jgi:hypothetical protein